ncbi:hypothetical protein Tco_1402905 [Tanacetum coccineum]
MAITFLRYIDTRPNGDALRKYILKGPYTPTIVTTPVVPAIEDSLAVPEQTTVKTVMNMTPENRAHFESEKKRFIDIDWNWKMKYYSTVTACQTVGRSHRRLQQGELLNIQDVKTNLFWEFGQFTSHDGETIESYYTRFYKMMNEMIRNNLTLLRCKQHCSISSTNINQNGPKINEQELEAHYSYIAKIQEVSNADSGTDAEPLEQVQYDTDDNVFANDIQHFHQLNSISNTYAVERGWVIVNVTPRSHQFV